METNEIRRGNKQEECQKQAVYVDIYDKCALRQSIDMCHDSTISWELYHTYTHPHTHPHIYKMCILFPKLFCRSKLHKSIIRTAK